MKTRNQAKAGPREKLDREIGRALRPAKAGRREKLDREIGQALRPAKAMRPKLKQQKSTSVDSSCCSSRPTQLIKGGKSSSSSMSEGSQGIHLWTKEEQDYLVECYKDEKMKGLFQTCKTMFYEKVAEELNKKSQADLNDRGKSKGKQYVKLDKGKVNKKSAKLLGIIKEHYKGNGETSRGAPLTEAEYESLLGIPGTSYSHGMSLSKLEKQNYTTPIDKITSLMYLNEYQVDNGLLVDYGQILDQDKYLVVFVAKRWFSERIKFLDDMIEREKKLGRWKM